ncbi:hypothetical protein EJ08DRAFT_702175 [Tothia fuscella]|uniref:Uncharacterized protein n=1 Tax=Tothia fuscella TaxID=1048955 RepID=A0A9P4NGY6_9PEZI|nr:hypothetical protein EJ08DRAFT_702175 [Tothia fuscella]
MSYSPQTPTTTRRMQEALSSIKAARAAETGRRSSQVQAQQEAFLYMTRRISNKTIEGFNFHGHTRMDITPIELNSTRSAIPEIDTYPTRQEESSWFNDHDDTTPKTQTRTSNPFSHPSHSPSSTTSSPSRHTYRLNPNLRYTDMPLPDNLDDFPTGFSERSIYTPGLPPSATTATFNFNSYPASATVSVSAKPRRVSELRRIHVPKLAMPPVSRSVSEQGKKKRQESPLGSGSGYPAKVAKVWDGKAVHPSESVSFPQPQHTAMPSHPFNPPASSYTSQSASSSISTSHVSEVPHSPWAGHWHGRPQVAAGSEVTAPGKAAAVLGVESRKWVGTYELDGGSEGGKYKGRKGGGKCFVMTLQRKLAYRIGGDAPVGNINPAGCGGSYTNLVVPMVPNNVVSWVTPKGRIPPGRDEDMPELFNWEHLELSFVNDTVFPLVPITAYRAQPKCQYVDCSTIYNDYRLSVGFTIPSTILSSIDPAWGGCATRFFRFSDPPIALWSASQVSLPTLKDFGPQAESTAAPVATRLPDFPAVTASATAQHARTLPFTAAILDTPFKSFTVENSLIVHLPRSQEVAGQLWKVQEACGQPYLIDFNKRLHNGIQTRRNLKGLQVNLPTNTPAQPQSLISRSHFPTPAKATPRPISRFLSVFELRRRPESYISEEGELPNHFLSTRSDLNARNPALRRSWFFSSREDLEALPQINIPKEHGSGQVGMGKKEKVKRAIKKVMRKISCVG